MDQITIDNQNFEASEIETAHANILLIKAKQGFLGCGYFNINTANRLNEAVAIVTGVKSYDDMLNAKVIEVSEAASRLGVELGMLGKEALLKINK